jgi:hypothetical protein
MKRIMLLIGAATLLAAALAGCPREDETPIVRQQAERYWAYLFRGRTLDAYKMLDEQTRGYLSYMEYAQKVGFGKSQITEIQDYWKAYYANTEIVINDVSIKRKLAIVSITLTIPDPSWFPDEAYTEAQSLGLEGHEYALFMISAQTKALQRGEIPQVLIEESTQLLKESGQWRIVFKDEE